MKEYLVPTGDGEAQFIERRSRFIGHIRCCSGRSFTM